MIKSFSRLIGLLKLVFILIPDDDGVVVVMEKKMTQFAKKIAPPCLSIDSRLTECGFWRCKSYNERHGNNNAWCWDFHWQIELKRQHYSLQSTSAPLIDRSIEQATGSEEPLLVIRTTTWCLPSSLRVQCQYISTPALNDQEAVMHLLRSRRRLSSHELLANDARKQLYEKEKEVQDLKLESMGLKHELKDANEQCILLFNEVQKACKVSFTLQADLKSKTLMLSEKHKIETDQNTAQKSSCSSFTTGARYKTQIQERDSTI
ncbi:hypothetical protein C5167_048827 [Papaver somniferum]|uniref:Uncharacterized protein n=1 Tax=Papaver somniferum TaxID=3469 RepID=A0A4Y7KLS2_PAPSO|nr:hypothetical protein C5167_048827 [Papaver somniferum]